MYDSTVDVLYNLYDLVEVGGFVVIDDFSWTSKMSFGARDAIMDFRLCTASRATQRTPCQHRQHGRLFRKMREVNLRRDLYEETLSERRTGSAGRNRQVKLRPDGVVLTVPGSMDRWPRAGPRKRGRQADAVTSLTSASIRRALRDEVVTSPASRRCTRSSAALRAAAPPAAAASGGGGGGGKNQEARALVRRRWVEMRVERVGFCRPHNLCTTMAARRGGHE